MKLTNLKYTDCFNFFMYSHVTTVHQDKEQFYHLPPKSPNLQATCFLSLALPVPECYINLVINVIQMASFI